MKRFAVPPNWPAPPRRHWVPPKTWRPDPSWPPAPEDWAFWVDGKGNAVRGPVGRYAGTPRRVVFAGAGGVALILALSLWALSGISDGNQPGTRAASVIDDNTSTPTPTPTPATPTTEPSTTPPMVEKSTLTPLPKPTKTRTKKTETTESTKPRPTRTSTSTKPTSTPSRRPTAEEVLAEYCRQHGWPPEMCNPDNWNRDPQTPPAR